MTLLRLGLAAARELCDRFSAKVDYTPLVNESFSIHSRFRELVGYQSQLSNPRLSGHKHNYDDVFIASLS
jgi:hypothetical protein